MAKVNCCLKRVFVFFNVLFGILGVCLLGIGILAHAFYHGPGEIDGKFAGIVFVYIIGASTLVVSILGAYGASKEQKWALIVFIVVMSLGGIALLRIAVPMLIARTEINSLIEAEFQAAVPLDQAEPEFRQAADVLQSELECCGLFNGYRDWGNSIPDSCLCPQVDQGTDKCERAGSLAGTYSSFFERVGDKSQQMVYKQSCYPIIQRYVDKALDATLGIFFGLAVMALIGLVLAVIILCQIKEVPVVVPAVFTVCPKPPKYSELYNTAS